MRPEYRLYTFVAGLYLSPLQCGLQSVHVCSELYANHTCYSGKASMKYHVLDEWARMDKTVIICNARTSAGVAAAYRALAVAGDQFNLPSAIFHEDAESLGGACTAAGIVVPSNFWDVTHEDALCSLPQSYVFKGVDADLRYDEGTQQYEFIKLLKSFPLA